MKFKTLLISATLLAFGVAVPAIAQVKPTAQQVIASHLPDIAPYFVASDRSSQFRVARKGHDVLDLDNGVVRAKYRISGFQPTSASSPAIAAKSYLSATHKAYGLTATVDDLKILDVISTSYSTHVTFQQTFEDLPVHGRYVKVNMDADGSPTMVLNGYAPHLSTISGFNTQVSYSSDAAITQLNALLTQESDNTASSTSEPELVVYPAELPRLAWKIIAWPETPAVELEVLIDAHDGSIIQVQNTSTHIHGAKPGITNPPDTPQSTSANTTSTSVARVTGKGLVFDPDPLTTAGHLYSSPFLDVNDGDSDEVNAERVLVDLLDISQESDGMFRLIGPHVQIVAETSGGTAIYTPPAETVPNNFQYTRSNDFFEAVNVYYHIDKSQRYLQSLHVGRDIQNGSLRTNPHGLGQADNSSYFPSQNYIAFGQGGVDDAEDAIVIWHEYGHALLQGSAPGLLIGKEGQALHEGWSDYWASSYARGQVESGVVGRDDWQFLFKWDSGDGTIWQGREITFTGKYPEDVFCDNGGPQCDIYKDGLLWTTTLMEIHELLGRTETDRLALASHAYLMHPVSFRDAAEAFIQADADLNGSANIDLLIQTFHEKGLIDLSTFGPLASHDEIQTTEQLGGTIPLTVTATGVSAPIQRVTAFYNVDDGPTETLELSLSADDTYEAQLPLPDALAEITYYIEIEDELNLVARLPASNFLEFSFFAGPDSESPTIQHVQHPTVTLVNWPAQLVATVDDNLGVDTVEVDFLIHSPSGNQIAAGVFGLTQSQGQYTGAFPVDIETLEAGSTVSYRIIARDISQAANETRLPATDYYIFNVEIIGGIFRQYDFETDDVSFAVNGAWERGTPSFGLEIAHSGTATWAINPDGPYSAVPQISSLELPQMNLAGLSDVYLVFWHWFDTEHDGTANPDSPLSTTHWDGGNLKVSTDGGTTWSVISPDSGYNGTISTGRENPMGGEPAFGGSSFGWRQESIPLPSASDVRLRFDFGIDAGNTEPSISYAGWYIDDLLVVTEKPIDLFAPIATVFPEESHTIDPGKQPNRPFITLFDSTGVSSVFVDYELASDAGDLNGSYRLSMRSNSLDTFEGPFPFAANTSLTVGDIITYRFRAQDFSGNETLYPAAGEAPLRTEYRLRDSIDLSEIATATGLWQLNGEDLWELSHDAGHQELSSLVYGPIDLPANVDNLQLLLGYDYNFEDNNGGNLKLSLDNAASWQVLIPDEGYPGFLADVDQIPRGIRGQSAFTGSGDLTSRFELLDYKGRQIWLRLDFGALNPLETNESWTLVDAQISFSTLEAVNGSFDIPRDLALHANYPDPFATQTTLSYTLSEQSHVKLAVYDILGRRILSLVDADQAADTYSLLLDGSMLSNGLYLVRLETNHGSQTERIMVAK